MSRREHPPQLHALGLPSEFVVDTRLGIENLLQAIVKAKRPARVACRTTSERATVRLLEIDSRRGRILFVPLAAREMHGWLDDARDIVFNTDHGGIPVEFTCERPSRVGNAEAATYSVRFPRHIIRLQRRNAYRLPLPGITCTLHDDDGSGPDRRPHVLDVSAGGVDLAMPLTETPLSRDAAYACTIVLPGLGTIWVRLAVVSIARTAEARRYGCQFMDLPAASELLLQRYILDEQRARRQASRTPPAPRD
jgi:c-di-GMP-binding flagellar brake protein YcgR